MNNLRTHILSLVFAGLALASPGLIGCGSGGPVGGPGQDGGGQSEGGKACAIGEVGCACDSTGSCDSGECVADVCMDCTRGGADCACRANGSCDTDLHCSSGVCAACADGKEGCACGPSDACDTGLACKSGKCAKAECVEGKENCPCLADDPKCEGTDYCDDNDMCRACSSDVVGCACETNGECSGGLVCDIDSCRAARTCVDLLAEGLCGAHQACTEGDDADATCEPAQCDTGYEWEDVTSECTKCKLANCAPVPTCTAGVPGSIKNQCASESRLCVKTSSGAECGGCIASAMLVGDQCVPQIQCGAVACAGSEYCDRNDDTCKTLPCATGSAKDDTDTCVPCAGTCSGKGLTGRFWPFREELGQDCVCETQPGYFMVGGSSGNAIACDSDADGWVRSDADSNNINNDDALKQNSRCDIREVDGVLLQDEYGIQMEVGSCSAGEGLVMAPTAGTCTSRIPMKLLEAPATDKPTVLEAAKHVYGYPGLVGTDDDGRVLDPRELNALTKGCVSSDGNFNGGGLPNPEDVSEVQSAAPGADPQARLLSFAFFMELETSSYQAPAALATYGKLVIRERLRCDLADFPLRYTWDSITPFAPDDEYAAVSTTQAGGEPTDSQRANYWRNCTRFADPLAVDATTSPGFDYARFSPAPGDIKPPSAMFIWSELDLNSDLVRNFGACELAAMGANVKPVDNVWRGMQHHSQFKCVRLTDTVNDPIVDHLPGEFGSGNDFTLNVCHAKDCDPLDTACVESRRTATGSHSYEPAIECRTWNPADPLDASSGVAVGFAAVNYHPYGTVMQGSQTVTYGGGGDYAGGCISEDVEWGAALCGYPNFSMSAETSAFGRYSCWNEAENYLWAASNAGGGANESRATLYWAASATESKNFFMVPTVLR